MSQASRRSFLAVAGSGAVTTAVVAAAPSSRAASASSSSSSTTGTQPLVAHVRDAAAGMVVLYIGSRRGRRPRPRPRPTPDPRSEAMTMSSHREAPEISKDPVADNTDVYAFVSPDKPRHRHPHRELHPLPEPAGRPELLRVRRRRPLRDPREQPRRRPCRRDLPVPVHHQGAPRRHLPLQHRPPHLDRRPELEPPAVLLRHPRRAREGATASGHEPGLPPGQRRHPEHPALRRRLHAGGGPPDPGQPHRLRRSAR